MEKVFAIGDIHGNYELFEKLLPFWNPDNEQLVFLGDYIDRGPDSLKVIQTVMDLSKKYGAITLSGNHEQLFLNWLADPEQLTEFYFHLKVGGIATVENLISKLNITIDDTTIKDLVNVIQNEYGEEIEFINNLLRHYHWDPYLFVHAGIDVNVEQFTETKEDDFLWIREEFIHSPHKSKEIVVFGHTPTIILNEDKKSKVWISPCRKKIDIDGGGAIYDHGHINGVVFTKEEKEFTVHAAGRNQNVISYTMQL